MSKFLVIICKVGGISKKIGLWLALFGCVQLMNSSCRPQRAPKQTIDEATKVAFYKKLPLAKPNPHSFSNLFGVNAYWGWGQQKYSDQQQGDEGPGLFAKIASHYRNYHDLTWDLNHPETSIDFHQMEITGGTPAKSWLNWSRTYSDWTKYGQDLQVSIQIYRFPENDWQAPYQSAYQYGYAFARFFGPTHGNGLVKTIEIGNEPWEYEAWIYQKILEGMAKGVKEADPQMKVFPCALQAADSTKESTTIFKNYLPARIPSSVYEYIDGINLHAYSFLGDNLETQIAVHPEHPRSSFWEILSAIQWRNEHLPNKQIHLSEWGWESSGGGEDCLHPTCVTEAAAASYAIRGLLIAARLGMDRATWFFFANAAEASSLFTRSGLVSSFHNKFQRKKAFTALETLLTEIGDKHFLAVYREDEHLWGYYLGTEQGQKTHLIIWRPQDYETISDMAISINVPFLVKNAWMVSHAKVQKQWTQSNKEEVKMQIGKEVVILKF